MVGVLVVKVVVVAGLQLLWAGGVVSILISLAEARVLLLPMASSAYRQIYLGLLVSVDWSIELASVLE